LIMNCSIDFFYHKTKQLPRGRDREYLPYVWHLSENISAQELLGRWSRSNQPAPTQRQQIENIRQQFQRPAAPHTTLADFTPLQQQIISFLIYGFPDSIELLHHQLHTYTSRKLAQQPDWSHASVCVRIYDLAGVLNVKLPEVTRALSFLYGNDTEYWVRPYYNNTAYRITFAPQPILAHRFNERFPDMPPLELWNVPEPT